MRSDETSRRCPEQGSTLSIPALDINRIDFRGNDCIDVASSNPDAFLARHRQRNVWGCGEAVPDVVARGPATAQVPSRPRFNAITLDFFDHRPDSAVLSHPPPGSVHHAHTLPEIRLFSAFAGGVGCDQRSGNRFRMDRPRAGTTSRRRVRQLCAAGHGHIHSGCRRSSCACSGGRSRSGFQCFVLAGWALDHLHFEQKRFIGYLSHACRWIQARATDESSRIRRPRRRLPERTDARVRIQPQWSSGHLDTRSDDESPSGRDRSPRR